MMLNPKRNLFKILLTSLALALMVFSAALAAVTDGVDVKVTNDNNNVDGGTPNPSYDAQNRQQNETTIAISPVDTDLVATGANDYRMVPVTTIPGWFLRLAGRRRDLVRHLRAGFCLGYVSRGIGFAALGLDGSGDPVVRFDHLGNLYVAGIAFNRNYDPGERPVDNLVYVAKYDYTPGTPGGTSTSSSAANPPNFTYAARR